MRLTSRTAFVAISLLWSRTVEANSALDAYFAAHPISTRTAVSANSQQTPITNATLDSTVAAISKRPFITGHTSARKRCPASCGDTGLTSTDWTAYHDVRRLALCNETMLLDFSIYNPLDDPTTHATIYACSSISGSNDAVVRRDEDSCTSTKNLTQVQTSLQMAWVNAVDEGDAADVVSAAQQMSNYLIQQTASCNETISFAYSGQGAIGLYAGSGIQSQGISTSILQKFISQIESGGISESLIVQACAGDGRSAKYAFGIVASASADLAFVQQTVKSWKEGDCITTFDGSSAWENITISIPAISTSSNSSFANSTLATRNLAHSLTSRATECTTVQVVSMDTCTTLAGECGITPAQFTVFNPSTTLCSSLTAGQHVCCSAGTLPDFSPKPFANGTCANMFVESGTDCSTIAATNSLTVIQLENFNNLTWGFMGCGDLQAGQYICLSSGSPPMPAVVSNAVCGPQVPGTPIPPSGTDFSTLNTCPLNACCDIWGQCGTTTEFCTPSDSPTKAPGTAAVGQNGCISNCGTEIVIGDAPAEFLSVAYFEGYDNTRPCLNSPVTTVDSTKYTHVHLSFAALTPGYDVDVSLIQAQFDQFVTMTGFKRILSFGGWTFSTDPSTYFIFREAMQPANILTTIDNIVAFVNKYDLDGVDLDWEYPGEPDIPGIPAGSIEDGTNYFLFLFFLKEAMIGKSVSVTAPTSFWYLQNYPIAAMSEIVDYVVFMSYDLHGQWDYSNAFSDPSCPGGNCLRSDVNLTETLNGLSMVTKAGVPSGKLAVGVTSYGRSFQMTTAGCYTEQCTYTGPASGAFAGPCTGTPGYIANAEIDSILNGNGTLLTVDGDSFQVTEAPFSYLDDSFSNIVVYGPGATQWVGYMDDDNKATRALVYAAYNMGGTADWAVDLQSFAGDGADSSDGASTVIIVDPSIWTGTDPSAPCEPPCILVLPPYPLGGPTVVTWPILTTTLASSSAGVIVTITTTITVPAFTITEIDLQPITLSATDDGTYVVAPVQSIMPPSFIWTIPPNVATFTPTPIPTDWSLGGFDGHGPSSSSSSPGGGAAATSSTSIVAGLIPSFVWNTIPFPITIQPMPTISIHIPPLPKPIPPITIGKGTPKLPCIGLGCGSRNCGIFGCKPKCGLFGCDGGCGIFGCGGGCGPFGCIGDCFLDVCGGVGCEGGGCGGGGGDGDDDNEDCDDPVTASACTILISSFKSAPMTEFSTTTKTHCDTTVECSAEDTLTTTTITTSEPHITASVSVIFDSVDAGGFDYASIESSIMQQRMGWDITRFSGMTVNPFPFTTTDGTGNVVQCQSSTVDNGATACAGSSSTIHTAFPFTTTDSSGDVIECGSSSVNNGATVCAGSSSTIHTGNPFPYTSTDIFGDIIECQSSTVNNGATSCAGGSSTVLTFTPATPSATCYAEGTIFDGVKVYIFTNYITDGGVALEKVEASSCLQTEADIGWQGYTGDGIAADDGIENSDGSVWYANNMWFFTLNNIVHPQQLECISRGIAAAGGPTLECDFTPALEELVDDIIDAFLDFLI